MIFLFPLVLFGAFMLFAWMLVCMMACVAGGLALRLCVGGLHKKEARETPLARVARQGAAIGVAGMVIGMAGTLLFVIFLELSLEYFLIGEIGVYVCTLLCIVCGVWLMRLGGHLRRAVESGAPYGKRQMACMLCGGFTLVLSLPGVALAVLLLSDGLVG